MAALRREIQEIKAMINVHCCQASRILIPEIVYSPPNSSLSYKFCNYRVIAAWYLNLVPALRQLYTTELLLKIKYNSLGSEFNKRHIKKKKGKR